MEIMNIYGHIIIICIGVPVIVGLVRSLRDLRIHYLLLLNVDKMKSDVDALNQIMTFQQMVSDANINKEENATLIGIVNLHVLECQSMDCPCKNEAWLYDAGSSKFSKRDGKIFLNSIL